MARVLFSDRVRGPVRGRLSRKRVRQHPIPGAGRLGGTGDTVGAALRRASREVDLLELSRDCRISAFSSLVPQGH